MGNLLDNMTPEERAEATRRMLKDIDKEMPTLPNVVNIDISYGPSSRANVLKILAFVDKIRDLQTAEEMDISVLINVKQNK